VGAARLAQLLAAAVCLAAGAAPAGAATLSSDLWYHDGHTARWRIAGTWRFAPDPRNVGQRSGWASRIPARTRPVSIPNVWNASLSDAGFKGSVGWYYARFTPPHAGRYRIRFLSTHHLATAYIDGAAVGAHEGGFLAWETRPVRLSARPHLLAVRTDNRPAVTTVQTGGEAWWNWGGISREVELREARAIDVQSVRMGTLALAPRGAVVRVAVDVANTSGRPRAARVAVSVAGTEAAQRMLMPRGARRTVTFLLRVRDPRLWSPEQPSLYRLNVATGSRGRMARAWTGMVGIARLENRGGTLYLNGRQFFARGAALHDMAHDVGAALTPRDLRANLELLRGLHANFTRAHYPLHPGFLEMLDRAGIVVWGEAPVIWLTDKQLGTPAIRATALGYVRQAIKAEGYHPSVQIWSAGNELASEAPQGAGFVGYVRAAHDLVRWLDPTRPFALAFESRPPEDYAPFCGLLDIFGLNSYLGWYYGPPPGPEQRQELRDDLATKTAVCPDRAWLITEFGAEAGFPGAADLRGSYGYQAAYIDSTLQALQGVPHVNGASIWAGRDFAVAPGWAGGNEVGSDPPFNQKGLVTLNGYRKPAYEVASRWFAAMAGR
jgi:beta-glucuronidase